MSDKGTSEAFPAWREKEIQAWPGMLSASNSLPRFTQAPPATYGKLCDALPCGHRPFDPGALWLWTVMFDALRSGRGLSAQQLFDMAGVAKSTGRRLLAQLNMAGLLLGRRAVGGGSLIEVMVALPTVPHAIERLKALCPRCEHPTTRKPVQILVGTREELIAAFNEEAQLAAGLATQVVDEMGGALGVLRAVRSAAVEPETLESRLQERYFPTEAPEWTDPDWVETLCRRYGRAVAMSAIGQVNFLLDGHGGERPHSPRGYALKLAGVYAGRKQGRYPDYMAALPTLKEKGERLRADHEIRRREVIAAQKSANFEAVSQQAFDSLRESGLIGNLGWQ